MLKEYFRITRLHLDFDVWTLLIPCWWGFFFSLYHTGETAEFLMQSFILLTAGSVLMLGVGATYDDIVDRKLDAKVARTKDREIASEKVALPHAWLFLFFQIGLCLVIAYFLRPEAVIQCFVAGAILSAYPFIKRFSHLTGIYLGICINWGVLVTFMQTTQSINITALLVFLSCFFLTCFYNTVYEIQDKADDKKAGIKSMALLLGDRIKIFLYGCLALMLASLFTAGISAGITTPLYYVMIFAVSLIMPYKVYKINLQQPESCYHVFHFNRTFAALLTTVMLCVKLIEHL